MAIFKKLKERVALRRVQKDERKSTPKSDRKSLKVSQKAERKNLRAIQNPKRHIRKQVRKYEKTVKKDRKDDVKEIRKSEKAAIKKAKKGTPTAKSIKASQDSQERARTNALANQKMNAENKPKVAPLKTKKVKIQADKPVSFSTAFKNARSAQGGDGGVFTWKGKKYNTNLAKKKAVTKKTKKTEKPKTTETPGGGTVVKTKVNRPNVPIPKKANHKISQGKKIKTVTGGKKGAYQFKEGGFLEKDIDTLFE